MSHFDKKKLYGLLTALFQRWQLTRSQQAHLLGLSAAEWNSIGRLEDFDIVVLDRAIDLLDIHRQLRVLFPENPELRYSWITTRNHAFDQRTPLNVMCEEGKEGTVAIARYLADHADMSCTKR